MNQEDMAKIVVREDTHSNLKEYIPSKSEILREHVIELRFLSSGCVIRIGCKEIAFGTIEEAMVALNAYVRDPYTEGKEWKEKFKQ